MIAMLTYVASLISITSSAVDNFPILSKLNCTTCPSVYVPVCTDNDLTFANECRVQCYNDKRTELRLQPVNIVYYGTCVNTFVQVGVQVPGDWAEK